MQAILSGWKAGEPQQVAPDTSLGTVSEEHVQTSFLYQGSPAASTLEFQVPKHQAR